MLQEHTKEQIKDIEPVPGTGVKISAFDSECEEKFYTHLMRFIGNSEKIAIDVHVHLSEIFEDKDIENKKGKEKYRLNNMHCDFIISDKILAG